MSIKFIILLYLVIFDDEAIPLCVWHIDILGERRCLSSPQMRAQQR